MRRTGLLIAVVLTLIGCGRKDRDLERGMLFRTEILRANACSFTTEIVADYGDETYSFVLQNTVDPLGEVSFSVTKPDTIAGIRGKIRDIGGEIHFKDTALAIPLLTEEKLSPISAPWILMKTLRSGYITSSCSEGDLFRLSIDDSYHEDALMVDIWMNRDNRPVHAEILHNGEKILTIEVLDFRIQ